MKSLIALVLLFFSLGGFSQNLLDTTMEKAMSPDGYKDTKIPFRNFSDSSIDGELYTNDSLENKITFINFWFEACAPCIAEFDALNDLYRKYSKHGDFRFLSFTLETPEAARRVVQKYQLVFPVICLEKTAIHDLLFQLGFPTTMVTDWAGVISFVNCGGPNEAENARFKVDTIFCREVERQLYLK